MQIYTKLNKFLEWCQKEDFIRKISNSPLYLWMAMITSTVIVMKIMFLFA